MNKFKQYLSKIFFLTQVSKTEFSKIILCFILVSLLDLFGIGLISVYATLLLSPEILMNTSTFSPINDYINNFSIIKLSLFMGILLIIIFIIKLIVSIVTYKIIFNFTHSRQKALREKLLQSYQLLSYERYINLDSSESVSSIGVYVKNYGAVINGLLLFIGDMIIALFISTLLFLVNGLMLVSLIIFLGLIIFIYKFLFINNFSNLGKNLNEGYRLIYQGVQEYFDGFKELYVLDKHSYFENKILSGTDKVAISDSKQSIIAAIPRFILELAIVIFIVFLVSISLLKEENINSIVPILTVFAAASIRLAPMFNQISRFLSVFTYGQDSIDKLYDDINGTRLSSFKKNYPKVSKLFTSLKISNLSYKYKGTNNFVLQNISLNINSGDAVAITGASGSGKTTLVDILLGLLTPNTGIIEINESVINFSDNYLRSKVAYLPQEIFLVNDNILHNVALGENESDINIEKVWSSLDRAQLGDFIRKKNNGLGLELGQKGINLSGGQKQRVALARSFYYDREIIIFDEATSALDKETEKEIVNQINLLKGNKTVIIISHNKDTIAHCNKIYSIKDGKISEIVK